MAHVQGIRRNWPQFALQLLTVFAVGLTIGAERNVVPVLGQEVLGVESMLVIGSFVVSFGFVKAVLNLYGGKWSESYGRKPILIAGWLVALPIPVILIYAPNWWWITLGNVLLGINQSLAWSMSVNAKIDLAGSDARGFAVGLDEAFGYGGVAVGTWVTGVIVVALVVSVLFVEETLPYAQTEAEKETDDADADLPFREILKRATWGDRTLFAAAQAGSVEKFVDALVWIAFPLYSRPPNYRSPKWEWAWACTAALGRPTALHGENRGRYRPTTAGRRGDVRGRCGRARDRVSRGVPTVDSDRRGHWRRDGATLP